MSQRSIRNSWQHNLATMTVRLQIAENNADVNMIEDAMQQALDEAREHLVIDPNERVGLALHTRDQQGNEVIIRIPFRTFQLLTVEDIISEIENTLNSYQELDMDDVDLTITVLRRTDLDNLEGKGCTLKGNLSSFIHNSKGLVQINPNSDPVNESKNCFPQWIVIGLAYNIQKGLIQPIPELELTEQSYVHLVQSRHRFKKRKYHSELIKGRFNFDRPSEEILREIQSEYHLYFVLFSIFKETQVQFPPASELPVSDPRPVICGLLQGRDINKWDHVDFVTRPTYIATKVAHRSLRFCNLCFEIYARKQGCNRQQCGEDVDASCGFCHICINACPGCKSIHCGYSIQQGYYDEDVEEEETRPFREKTKCRHCRVALFSSKCERIHQEICRELFCKRCEICCMKEHRGLLCGETRCFICGDIFDFEQQLQHQCFLKREKLKKENHQLVVYDFECVLNEDKVHVPYLCTACFPKGHPEIEVLKVLFPFEFRNQMVVFVFWGLGNPERSTGVYQFFEFVCHPLLSGFTFFAHNAKSYDGILIKNFMTKYRHQFSNDIQRGQKFISMRYEELNLEFRDSYCYIPSSLRVMSAEFGIEELKKGFFPHSIMTLEYLQQAEQTAFYVAFPPREAFHTDFKAGRAGREEKQELDTFLDQFYSQQGLWNLKKDCIEYCISDTLLLGEVLFRFSETMKEMTSTIERPEGVDVQEFDPLAYITLPSAMMSFFLSQMLPEKTIAVIDRAQSLKERDVMCFKLWKEFQLQERLIQIKPEVFEKQQGGMIVYRDCYSHGCRICYSEFQRNERMNCPFSQCFQLSCKQIQELACDRPEIVWEHEFNRVKQSERFKNWFVENRIDSLLPIDPREVYKGGKVEVTHFSYPDEIQMADYASEYPTICLGSSQDPTALEENRELEWYLPVGLPTRIIQPHFYDVNNQKEGIIKCRVLPPTDLYAPFLSYKVQSRLNPGAYEVLYGCCKLCMEERSFPCSHTNYERSFVGTWTLMEIRYAVTLGYEVMNVVEVWEYPERSKSLLKDFMVPFVIEKIVNKRGGKIVNNQFTPKGQEICDYIEKLSGKRLTVDDFKDLPARVKVAKLAMNSFTGKWGEHEIHRSHRTFTAHQRKESRKLISNPSVEILFAQVLDLEGEIVTIEFQERRQCARAARRKNDIIVAYITAGGRCMLSLAEQALGRNLLYTDTDSVFHKKLPAPVYKDGFRIGDLEIELTSGHSFVSAGRKWYSYQLPNGDNVNKLKGFTLKASLSEKFSPENLFNHIWECKEIVQENEIRSSKEFSKLAAGINVDQVLFKTDYLNSVVPFKRTVQVQKKALFQILSAKRHILFPATKEQGLIDSVPFGFRG